MNETTEIKTTEVKKVAMTTDIGVVKGNIVSVLAYLGTILASILLLILEKDNKFVRFHAAQSLITAMTLLVIVMIVSAIASVFWALLVLIPLIWLLGIILIIFLMYKAYQGEMYRLPLIGDFAAKYVGI